MWRDDASPYSLVTLSDEQIELSERVRDELPARCFQHANAGYVADHRDAHIVAESIALAAKMLMTSNLRTINHRELNAWAMANGARLGFRAKPVVHEADGVLVEKAQTWEGTDRLLQAGLMACWPADDRTAADEIVKQTIARISSMSRRRGGRLPKTGELLSNGLQNHERAVKLVETIRRSLPSRTITTDREHPTFPRDPATAPSPATGAAAAVASRMQDDDIPPR